MELKPGDVKLVLRAEKGNPTPAIVRLRQAFKLLLRKFGLRVVWCAEVPAEAPKGEEAKGGT